MGVFCVGVGDTYETVFGSSSVTVVAGVGVGVAFLNIEKKSHPFCAPVGIAVGVTVTATLAVVLFAGCKRERIQVNNKITTMIPRISEISLLICIWEHYIIIGYILQVVAQGHS